MALPQLTKKKAEQLLGPYFEKKIPTHARDKVRLTIEYRGNNVTIFEDRPGFRDPEHWTHFPIAQFRFKTSDLKWSLYWRDRNLKWHFYDRREPTHALEDLLAEVDRDPTGIFWG